MSHAAAHAGHATRRAPLVTALALTGAVALFEFFGGLRANSIALVTDSAHVLMDAIALGIALFARAQAQRPPNERQSFGFARVEMLAALANGALLLGITAFVVLEAIHRFAAPALPLGNLMSAVAAVSFAVNCVIGVSLARSAHGDLNVRAAVFHVASDAAGALAIALGGLAVSATGATWIDPALSLLVCALIVAGVLSIVRDAGHVLLESAPDEASIPDVRARMRAIAGVVDVHDLHVWTIGSGSHVLTAHVLLADARISEASAILRDIESTLHDDFGIHHVTIQFECDACGPSDRIVCVNEAAPAGEA